jgi:hypothetical protein
LVACLSLAGCGAVGLPFEAGTEAGIRPAKAPKTQLVDRVNPSDLEVVREKIASVPVDHPEAKALAWQNPDTGSDGILTRLVAAPAKNCRDFATTINDSRGIRHYSGQACRSADGAWRLTAITPDDAATL